MKYWADNYLNSLLLSLVWQLNPWQSTFTHNERGGSQVWMWEYQYDLCVSVKTWRMYHPQPQGSQLSVPLHSCEGTICLETGASVSRKRWVMSINIDLVCTNQNQYRTQIAEASGTPGPLCPRRLMFRVSPVMPGMIVNQKILFIARSIDD